MEDSDRIFLRIDYSATNKMKLLMQNKRMEQPSMAPKKEPPLRREDKKEISNNVLMIMYPTSIFWHVSTKLSHSGNAET